MTKSWCTNETFQEIQRLDLPCTTIFTCLFVPSLCNEISFAACSKAYTEARENQLAKEMSVKILQEKKFKQMYHACSKCAKFKASATSTHPHFTQILIRILPISKEKSVYQQININKSEILWAHWKSSFVKIFRSYRRQQKKHQNISWTAKYLSPLTTID